MSQLYRYDDTAVSVEEQRRSSRTRARLTGQTKSRANYHARKLILAVVAREYTCMDSRKLPHFSWRGVSPRDFLLIKRSRAFTPVS